jgi:acetolactate synthase-1/2/3 large subunit
MVSQKPITVAKAIVECLKLEGITTVFGYPGATICPFYDELLDSGIEHILVRQESNAGHAASGYARIKGKPAVCITTSGPGATNLITAVATAYMDSIPLVAITGQVNTDQIGRDVFQEADITGATEPFVKHSYLVKDGKNIAEIMKKAFYIAGTGRRGPVLIDVPMDVQQSEVDFSYPDEVDIRSYKPRSEGNKLQIRRVCEAIAAAERPLICAGGGLFSSPNAKEAMLEFAEKADIPIINTMMGISSVPSNHPLFFGMLGMHGRKTPNNALVNCDLLILLGARVGDRAVSAINSLSGLSVVHIDVDPAEIGKNIKTALPVVGDLGIVLSQLLEAVEKKENPLWRKQLSDNLSEEKNARQAASDKNGVNVREFYKALNARLPKHCVVVADVGQNQIWTANNTSLDGGRFLTSGGMGTMGYSVPAAIGAKKADASAEVVAICGDGSFQMQSMELATIMQHDIPIKIVVMVNKTLGMVRELQDLKYGGRHSAVSLDGSPDFIKLASAYGIEGEYLSATAGIENSVKNLIMSGKPYILAVNADKDERSIGV